MLDPPAASPAAAVSWRMEAVDLAWARLAADAAAHDMAAFAAERDRIARLSGAVFVAWGAQPRETYATARYSVATYSGPPRVRGERGRSAYFAVVTPRDPLAPPTLWEVTPGYAPWGGALWNLRVSGCDLASGDPRAGYPRQWRTARLERPPAYADFKASLSSTIAAAGAFPANTYTAHTPGTTCLYVGDLSTERLAGGSPAPPR